MPELSLDHDQRDPLARHLDRVRVPELMRREPATNTRLLSGVMQLAANPGARARPSACRAAQNAAQRAERQGGAELEPWFEVRPAPAVHADLPTLVTLPVPHENGPAV